MRITVIHITHAGGAAKMRLLILAALATLFVLTLGQGPPGPIGPPGDPGVCIGCPDVVSDQGTCW